MDQENVKNFERNKDFQLTIDKIFKYGLYIAPDQKLIFYPYEGMKKEFTYTDFSNRVKKLGKVFENLNIKRGEKPWEFGSVIAVMDWNTIRFQELMFAVPMYGATLFTVNIRLSLEEILYTMKLAEPEILFFHSDFLPYINPILKNIDTIKTVIYMNDEMTLKGEGTAPTQKLSSNVKSFEYENLIKNTNPENFSWPELNEYAVAGLFFTSGTTGKPKGVYHTHRQITLGTMQLMMAQMEYPIRLSNRDTILTIVPYFHIFGWLTPYTSIISGNSMIFPSKYDWKNIAKVINEYLPQAKKVNGRIFGEGVPTMLYSIIQEEKKLGISDLNGFVYGYGGQALPISVYEDAKKMNIEIITGYGPSETLTAITRSVFIPRLWMNMGLDNEKLIDHFVKNNSLGVLIPFSLNIVVDQNGKEVPQDGKTPGRFLFNSPTVAREYFKDPDRTKYAFRYGLLDVDDLVLIDKYGCVMFVDREKDVIKSGGEWIPSSEMENLISMYPGISEVAVIGISDPQWVERPIAVITLKPESTGKINEKDIINYLVENFVEKGIIPKWWIPDKIIFVKELPKTSTAKIDKKAIKQQFDKINQ
ncbi:MAG: AMP-binding protein [Thermoplasmata archaeon]